MTTFLIFLAMSVLYLVAWQLEQAARGKPPMLPHILAAIALAYMAQNLGG